MSFLIFHKENLHDETYYINGHEHYKLAGYGLLYKLWKQHGLPTECGWTVTADQILKQHNPTFSDTTHSLVIDFHPSALQRIALVEIEKIHLYTYGTEGIASWTPMMLQLRDTFYQEYEHLTQKEKQIAISRFKIHPHRERIFEFLYLNGSKRSWNWGRNGMTNAAFIYEDARNYFAPFFTDNINH